MPHVPHAFADRTAPTGAIDSPRLVEETVVREPRWDPLTWVGLTVLALVALAQFFRTWRPIGDYALVRIWTAAVGGAHTPLIGGDARFGWNHLGPAQFYLLAGPFRIAGGRGAGLLAGAALVNLAALVLVARSAARASGRRTASLVVIGALVFLASAEGPRFVDPWNPYLVQLCFLLCLTAVWATLAGGRRWLAVAVVAGSVAIQSHILFALPVALLLLVGLVTVLAGLRTDRPAVGRTLVLVGAESFLVWLPTIVDMLFGRRNVRRVIAYARTAAPGRTVGVRLALRVLLRETGLQASWLGGKPPFDIFSAGFTGARGFLAGAGLVALLVGGVVAHRLGHRDLRTLAALVGGLVLLAVPAISMLSAPLYPYLWGWVSLCGMLCWAMPVSLLAREWRAPAADRVLAGIGVVAALAVAARGLGAPPRSPRERPGDGRAVGTLVNAAEPRLDRHTRYRVLMGEDRFNSVYLHGVVDGLRSDGFHVEGSSDMVVLYGTGMVAPSALADPTLHVVAPFYGSAGDPGVIAVADPLTPAERAEERALTASAIAAFDAAGHSDAAGIIERTTDRMLALAGRLAPGVVPPDDLARLETLRRRGPAVAVTIGTAQS